jgi:hypothetical protein
MKFALVFVTTMMGANVSDAPLKAVYATANQCEVARRPLVKPAKLKDHTDGWQCVPVIGKSGN